MGSSLGPVSNSTVSNWLTLESTVLAGKHGGNLDLREGHLKVKLLKEPEFFSKDGCDEISLQKLAEINVDAKKCCFKSRLVIMEY